MGEGVPFDSDPSFIGKVQFTRRYTAPSSIVGNETRCRTMQIPIDDNGQVEAAIAEVLGYLANPLAWQEVAGSVSSFVIASAMSQMLVTLFAAECGETGDLPMQFFVLAHTENQNVEGGTTGTNIYNKHPLNTEMADNDNLVSLSGGDAVVQAGTWLFIGITTVYRAHSHHAAIFNVTLGTRAAQGINGWTDAGYAIAAQPIVVYPVVFATPQTIRLEVYALSAQAGNGLGVPANKAQEVYAYLIGLKMA